MLGGASAPYEVYPTQVAMNFKGLLRSKVAGTSNTMILFMEIPKNVFCRDVPTIITNKVVTLTGVQERVLL